LGQKDENNAQAFLGSPRSLFVGATSEPLNALKRVLVLCREHDLTCRFVIYPYHANMLDLLSLTGLWPAFEDWKRELVRLVATSGEPEKSADIELVSLSATPTNGSKLGDVELWDFSGYHRYAREQVPAVGDRTARVQWYWEAGHFKRELGDKMLERIYGSGDSAFGLRAAGDNVEKHLAGEQSNQEAWQRAAPGRMQELREIVVRRSFGQECANGR
jgi:hypothetical protein